ncbi:MAG: site-2 protease family protein [Phycisphaerales bacterium]|nr:MAG: site-2 protease family protein [Phycisphaerales bacterium]
MSKNGSSSNRTLGGIFWIVVLAVVVFLIVKHVGVAGNVALVLIGFGSVVLIHEFGHFIIAKLGGIKVEGFSIGMPPTLLGLQRTGAGLRLRILPMFFSKEDEEPDEGGMTFTFGKGGKASDTEYRVGLIPFGGYVKLLGQEDIGPVKQIDDARSFANKPIGIRIAVIAAGVTFNFISAAIILMTVFLVGITFPPAVVGGVVPGSPAAEAGLQAGDELIEIDGSRDNLDFSSIALAAALSGRDEPIAMTVRRRDGSTKEMSIVARRTPGSQMAEFGIMAPQSLTLATITDPNILEERTGLRSGDTITAVDGQAVERHWDFAEIIADSLAPAVTVSAERAASDGTSRSIEVELPLTWSASEGDVNETDLNHVYSMVPRLRVLPDDLLSDGQTDDDDNTRLRGGDIIVAAGDIENPTYAELRAITVEYEGKPLSIKILRVDSNGIERPATVIVTPKRAPESDRVIIGFLPALDAGHPVVAKTIDADGGPAKLDIPRGARITAVNGRAVSSYYDIIAEVRRWEGQSVKLEYQLDGRAEGGVTLQIDQTRRPIAVASTLEEELPLDTLERLYKASSPVEAIRMGYRRTLMFVAQTYVTFKQLIAGLISPKLLMGPVGIVVSSYQIVEGRSLVYYAYFLGLISASIAVLNLMPMPPFDGGLIAIMLVEKVKGSALSEKAQGVMAYAGWVLVGTLLLYVTFNDIVRTLHGFLN